MVASAFTVCVNALDVVASKTPSPRYSAVIVFVPAGRLVVAKVATSLPFSSAWPMKFPWSRKTTRPVGPLTGVPLGATVSVKTTCCPTYDVLTLAVRLLLTVLSSIVTVLAAEACRQIRRPRSRWR